MFLSLIEEVRYCIEGSGSRYSKVDRQDAFLKDFRGDQKQKRSAARDKHGHPDEPDSVFPNTKEGRATKPGHGAHADKLRHMIFNRKFKYSDKYKRPVIGPKGKIPG